MTLEARRSEASAILRQKRHGDHLYIYYRNEHVGGEKK